MWSILYSRDNVIYHIGPYTSRDEVLKVAREAQKEGEFDITTDCVHLMTDQQTLLELSCEDILEEQENDDFSKRYIKDGKPLVECPSCHVNLNFFGNVDVEFVICGHHFRARTCINNEGLLIDVDGAVENGYHSETLCTKCGKSLVEWEE